MQTQEQRREYQRLYREAHREEAKQYTKEWQKNNRERVNLQSKNAYHAKRKYDPIYKQKKKENLRRWSLLTKYGLTLEKYNDLLLKQNNKCAICRTEKPGGPGDWQVDHCHITGKVRGLLCGECNTGLGKFKDNIELLKEAMEYLKWSSV